MRIVNGFHPDTFPIPFLKNILRITSLKIFRDYGYGRRLIKSRKSSGSCSAIVINQKIIQRLSITWYVYIGEKLSNAQFTVRYISRYTKRPAIAESRITGYTGSLVTFNSFDHKTKKLTFHTLPVEEFIGKLIRHIPGDNSRIIRYSGFYANRVRGVLLPKVFTIQPGLPKGNRKTCGSWFVVEKTD
jgi:hypothetical protein